MIPTRVAVLIPIKRFVDAKSRLRESETSDEVTAVAQALSRGVIEAAAPRTCIVLCDNDVVEEFSHQLGARVIRVAHEGLNAAVREGYRSMADEFEHVVIAHGDIAWPSGLGTFEFADGVTIVTDRHGRGTNVLSLPTGLEFNFAYGSNSAARHRAEAERVGARVNWIDDSPWGLDIDGPEDLALLRK